MFKKLLLVLIVFGSISYAVFATNVGRSFSIGGIRLPSGRASAFPFGPREPEEPEPPRYDPRAEAVIAEGRVASYAGATVSVGAEITGTLIELCVFENDTVRKGQLIAQMRADDYRASRDLAKADLDEASAEVDYWSRELHRLENLGKRNAATMTELDGVRRSVAVMVARKARAKAAIEQADALLAKTRVVAPIDGVVVLRSAHPGETLNVGAPIVKLVDLNRTRVEAEVDEYDVGKVALGTRCKITAEGFLGQSWAGVVEEIPAEVIPRRIRPEDPSRPADTRVVAVKVGLEEPIPLKLGQRVYVTIRHGRPGTRPDAPAGRPATGPGPHAPPPHAAGAP